MSLWKNKTIIVEAFKWTGGSDQEEDPQWIVDAMKNNLVYFTNSELPIVTMTIKTLEGSMTAYCGDYIIRDAKGEMYPCSPELFHLAYEALEE